MANSIDLNKLPPLKALKGFEAAARLLNYRKAADELNLTHPAIIHQIQLLEENMKVKLFIREGRNIGLTKEGEHLYPIVRESLESLISAAESFRRSVASPPIRIQTYVTASIRWLARRLSRFRDQYPDIELQLSTCNLDWQFDEANADIGVVYCETPPEPHLFWAKLFESRMFPVCSPKLIEGMQGKLVPKDIPNYPLLTVYTEARYWEIWLESIGVKNKTESKAIVVDTLAIALEMAADGEGIALVNGPFADDDLQSGRLVMPVHHRVKSPGEWGVVCRKDIRKEPRVHAFIEWLMEDAISK